MSRIVIPILIYYRHKPTDLKDISSSFIRSVSYVTTLPDLGQNFLGMSHGVTLNLRLQPTWAGSNCFRCAAHRVLQLCVLHHSGKQNGAAITGAFAPDLGREASYPG
jgi:hypothetical protein